MFELFGVYDTVVHDFIKESAKRAKSADELSKTLFSDLELKVDSAFC